MNLKSTTRMNRLKQQLREICSVAFIFINI